MRRQDMADDRVARRMAELERMRAEFGASAPASLRGFIDREVQKLRAMSDAALDR
jgi:hypothetical protein